MAFTSDAIDVMLDALGAVAIYASLHIVNESEVTGGSPAYARESITYAASSGGTMAANGTLPSFDVPACTVAFVGLYSASTAGTQYVLIDVTDEIFAAQGTYTLTALSLSGT